MFRKKPHENWFVCARDTSSWKVLQTIENKGSKFFLLFGFILVLICKFQLLLPDHIINISFVNDDVESYVVVSIK